MSYSRHYSRRISGRAHYSVSYGASDSGGTIDGYAPWSEDVDIDISVDTSSFDHGVAKLKNHIDGLTGAVVATEAAQIEEKIRSANSIGQSLTTGFFSLISSEITQQIAALKSKVDSLFLKLNDMKSACEHIQHNMQQDYHRITDRYTSVFEELDRELAMRIASLDKAAYTLKRDSASQSQRSYDSTLSTVPTVFFSENSHSQGVLSAGKLRSNMNDLLQSATAYLASEKQISKAVSSMLMIGDWKDTTAVSLPVAYLAVRDSHAPMVEKIILSPTPGPLVDDHDLKNNILARFRKQNRGWKPMISEDRVQIERFLIPKVDAIQTSAQDHDARVRQTILQLWTTFTPEMLSL